MSDKKKAPDNTNNKDDSSTPRRSSRLTTKQSSEQPQEPATPPKRVTRSTSKGGKKKQVEEDVEMIVEPQDTKGKEKEAAPEDVEMKPAEDEEAKERREAVALVLADLKQNFALLQRAVETIESRYTTRVLRTTASVRRRLNPEVLAQAVRDNFPKDDARKNSLLHYLGKDTDIMDVDETSPKEQVTNVLSEVDVYLHLLVIIYLLDKQEYEKGKALSTETVAKVQNLNRRTLDQLSARVYFYYTRFYELTGQLAEIRPTLLAAQRTATLRRDDDSQATLLNLLLRNYFHYNLYEQADKLVSKTLFPDAAGNNQLARYMYYLGRIKALQLDYTASHAHLLQAIRKAPQGPVAAGFQQSVSRKVLMIVYKFYIIVQLLMGEIPERSIFRQPILKKALIPYLAITQAVRVGDLTQFQEQLVRYGAGFQSDKTYTLILRLRHNVIKTGIRMISLSYSRISLRDICFKLHLDSEEDAEFIVAKAIRDGVIDATLDHDHGFMKSKENVDIYSTNEPQAAFHQRISFCLNLHNESVKAMRFPLNAHRKELASAEEARERERELAKEIAEGDMDEDDDVGDF
ncbi:proteasome regulatory subunit C-terminal-domain-containing protein [Endogone sp. FLAS-F59071]|nr:proteasome regulatory subunit C-terminal-domain-containing protein [Endogone sp. FLAS-F59071]|eukprot:RUS22332.1 proteasome regulatory subunit C-terminal-domain-containing protein [Endogone sp. FLAS-F59071]